MTAKEVSAINFFATAVASCPIERRKFMCSGIREITGMNVLYPLLDIVESSIISASGMFWLFHNHGNILFREFSRAGFASIECTKHWNKRKKIEEVQR